MSADRTLAERLRSYGLARKNTNDAHLGEMLIEAGDRLEEAARRWDDLHAAVVDMLGDSCAAVNAGCQSVDRVEDVLRSANALTGQPK